MFRSLPGLEEPDHSKLSPIPLGLPWTSKRNRQLDGRSLDRLGREAGRFLWEMGGRRLVGRSQFKCKCMSSARESWELIKAVSPLDLRSESSTRTVFSAPGDLTASDQSLQSVLDNPLATSERRAEALALKARNAKTHARALWEGKDEK